MACTYVVNNLKKHISMHTRTLFARIFMRGRAQKDINDKHIHKSGKYKLVGAYLNALPPQVYHSLRLCMH